LKPAKQPAKSDRTTIALVLVAALVAVGGIGFAIGHVTAPSAVAANTAGRAAFARPSLAPGQTFNPSTAGRGGLGSVAGGISGTVQSINGTTMTVQESNGTVVTVDLSGTTTYHGETTASPSAIQVGTGVTVQINTAALASQTPVPSASGALGGRTLTASSILITQP
jgi:preprotein translocase subunit YajC